MKNKFTWFFEKRNVIMNLQIKMQSKFVGVEKFFTKISMMQEELYFKSLEMRSYQIKRSIENHEKKLVKL